MKTLNSIFLILLLFGFAPKVSAFGPAGHKIVADIAMQYLSPDVKNKVLQILGPIGPDSAAIWMDAMRDDSSYNYMKPWHFINIDKGKAYDPKSTNNIIWELNRVYSELQHPEKLSKAAQRTDLCILFHLLGDLHQPLHVGYASDRGGNEVKVVYKNYHTDLHHFWDTDEIWNTHITAADCLKLSKTNAQAIAKTKFSPDQFLAFMNESRSLLPKVYSFGSGGVIDQTYVTNNKPVVELQLLRAGQRLAMILDQLFGAA